MTAPRGSGAGDALDALARDSAREVLRRDVATVEPLRAALGMRRFARVRFAGGDPATLIARIDAPEDPQRRPDGIPPEPALEPIRSLLERSGLPVPRGFGNDTARGIDWLEDLGGDALEHAAVEAGEARRTALYNEAVDLVPRIQRVAAEPGVAAFERRLGEPHFRYKAERFARYSLSSRGRDASPAEAQAVRDAFLYVARVCQAAPHRLAHRDLQSANLMLRSERPTGEQLVMIDLQGALLAPPEYDLVCLLRDSYVELEDAFVGAQLARVRPALPEPPEPETFAMRFDLLTLTRKGKDHALFLYSARELGDRRYLRYLPATTRTLKAASKRLAAREPALREVASLCAELPETACGV